MLCSDLVLVMYMLCFDLALLSLPIIPHPPASCLLSLGESPEAKDTEKPVRCMHTGPVYLRTASGPVMMQNLRAREHSTNV